MQGKKAPKTLIWLLPGKSVFVSRYADHVPPPDCPPPVEVGKMLRFGKHLGLVLPIRQVEGLLIRATSVAVQCIGTIDRFPNLDLDRTHVWALSLCQVLNDALRSQAEKDPEGFLRKFIEVEQKVVEERRVRKRRKIPGKRNR
jgi:hypothetical protein